jgi:mRNA-degrading endonuclease toxin of MazEF toxin-antitoxin module
MNRQPLQWSVFMLDLEGGRGQGAAGHAPVLVVSRESANEALPMVTVLPIVHMTKGRRIYPNETLLPAGATEIEAPAVLMAHLISTIPKNRLSTRMGSVEDPELRTAVRNAVRVHLDLDDVLGHGATQSSRLENAT